MKNKLIKLGYIVALICFIASLFLRISNAQEWVEAPFMIIGGILLTVSSLFKIITEDKR